MQIPLYTPDPEIAMLRKEIYQAIANVLDHGQFILGPEVERFEKRAAEYLGSKHAVGLNSGTDALVIALESLGIGEGDEVITTPASFFATAESISQVGARPVFADINYDTFNMDVRNIADRISPQTRAILPVHLFGRPVEMGEIMELAESRDLQVLEDCAQSFGADFGNQKTGSIGDAGIYSFFPTKNLGGIGDGGLLVTDDEEVAEQARMLRTHGGTNKYHNVKLGYNSRLDSIQAAVLDIKLNYVDEFNRGRRAAAQYYNDQLEELEGIETPEISEGHVFHQYTIRVKEGRRDSLKMHLAKRGIDTNIYFPTPQNELPVYEDKGYPVLPDARRMSEEVLSLPIWPHIEEETQQVVCDRIEEFLG